MLTIAEYDAETHTFFARVLNAGASSGEIVIPGKATDGAIRDYANDNLASPDIGNFSDAKVEWEKDW